MAIAPLTLSRSRTSFSPQLRALRRLLLIATLVSLGSGCNSLRSVSLPIGNGTTPTPMPIAPIRLDPTQRNEIGMNVGFTGDYSTGRMFADAMKSSRRWEYQDSETPVPVDANGWPQGDAKITVWHGIARMNGTYRLSFTGKAKVEILCCDGVITNLTYNPAQNQTTAELLYSSPGDDGLFLLFTQTQRTSTSPLNSGVTNVSLMRPITEGATASYPLGTLFTTPFKEALRPFKVLRFMDFLATNANQQKSWSDRTTPNSATMHQLTEGYGWQGKGGAYEYAIALCNELQADCWLTVPALADDQYVQNLATLVKTQLDPNLKLYLEYSNELWNFAPGFEQAQQNQKLAQIEVNQGRSPLNFDGDTNPTNWAWRRVAKRGLEISLIFRRTFGDQAMMTRVRPVLMTQLGYAGGPLLQAIALLQDYYNNPQRVSNPQPPSYYFYGVGGSAYYDPANTGPPDRLFSNFTNPETWVTALRLDVDYANAFGLKRIAYEAGPTLQGGMITDENRSQYRNDPRMTDAMVQAHHRWSAEGGGLVMYFTLDGESPWGFIRDVWDLNRPEETRKLKAMQLLSQGPKAKVNYGVALPATLPAAHYQVPPSWYNDRRISGLRPFEWVSYTVRSEQATTYSLSLEASADGPNAVMEVWVDGQLAGTLAIGNSLGISAPLAIRLTPGIHGVMIRPRTGTIGVERLIFSGTGT